MSGTATEQTIGPDFILGTALVAHYGWTAEQAAAYTDTVRRDERHAMVARIRAVLREADEMIPKHMGLFWKVSPTRRDQWRLDLDLFRALLDAVEERG